MLRTMSSLCVPNFDSAPLSMPKLEPIIHFPQVDPMLLELSQDVRAPVTYNSITRHYTVIKDLGWAR